MRNACEGVLYPVDAAAIAAKALEGSRLKAEFKGKDEGHATIIEPSKKAERTTRQGSSYPYIRVPHASWEVCRIELDGIFSELVGTKGPNDKEDEGTRDEGLPERIFVLAPLHKGQIVGRPFEVYTPNDGTLQGSDWKIPLETPRDILENTSVIQSDDVCTEEHSLEVIAPYLAVLYPSVPVCFLLAPGNDAKIDELKRTIGRFARNSIIFISGNEETHCADMWL